MFKEWLLCPNLHQFCLSRTVRTSVLMPGFSWSVLRLLRKKDRGLTVAVYLTPVVTREQWVLLMSIILPLLAWWLKMGLWLRAQFLLLSLGSEFLRLATFKDVLSCCEARRGMQYPIQCRTIHTQMLQKWHGTQTKLDREKENFLLTGLGGVFSIECYSPQHKHSRNERSEEEGPHSHGWDRGRTHIVSEQFKIIAS